MKHRVVVGATLIAVACGSACGSSEETETSGRSEGETATEEGAGEEAAEAVEDAVEEAEAAPPNDATRDIHGLRVTRNDDGSITLSGVDRWGARLDTTYADVTYFRNAIEVLKRSITEEQGTGLDAYAAELPEPEGGAAPPPVAPPPTMRGTMQTKAPAPATMEAAAAE